ncbi:TonB-dependent copper receptor [Azotobacter vinelandii]|uniref:TonB-dependent copper receptor n=2 Tax=Azotobacter vinelandii TaxID=354 RepID=UPI002666DFFF|nr:TonB-dependent copper receptor [Azotobacter vinelandii]WKN20961.1 TonB-dependent copper receptor [Azotobacter vinelandii]
MNRDKFRRAARPHLPKTFSRLLPHWRRAPAHAALLGLLASGSLPAAEPEDDSDSLQMSPLVITGVALDAPLTVVTDPRIPRQPVPASDGADYLKTIPGFSAIRSGGVNGDPVFRGMFGSRLKLLTNGGEMIGACPARMDSPSSYIAPETFDELTVIKGPQSVLHGPGASAATVLFERNPERFDAPGGRVDMSFLAGSNGRFDRRIDAAAGAEQGYFRLLANRSDADDYEDGDGDTVPSRWDKWTSEFVAGWTPTADSLLELTYGIGDGESRYAGRGMDGTRFDRESLGLRFELENIGEVFQKVEARLYYNYADHVMDNFRLRSPDADSSMPMPMASNVDRRTLGGRLTGTWRWEHYQLVAGLDYQTSEHRERSSTYTSASHGMSMGHHVMTSASFVDADDYPWNKDADFHNFGLFGELTRHLGDASRLVLGARLDRSYAEDHRDTLSGSMGMSSWNNPTAGKERGDTLPSGFVRYEHGLAGIPATAYVGLGHTQRFPDYWELFSSTNSMGRTSAFDSIHPEKTTQLDFGIQYARGPLEAWASGYLGWVRDFILFDYASGMSGMGSSSARNIDARIFGGEAGLSYRLSQHWKTDASLAYAWGKNSSDGRALPQIPPLEGRFSLTYEQGDWSASGLWRLVARQTRVAEGQGNVVGQDFGKSAGFGVLSFNGAHRFNRHIKLSAGVDNLLDKRYSEHLNLAGNAGFDYPGDTRINEPGRTLWARVDLSF